MALGFLIVAMFLGILMRISFIVDFLPFSFSNFKHAHSHIGLLGWVFMVFTGMLFKIYPKFKSSMSSKLHRRFFWSTVVAMVGMMLSFPIEGYGPLSIMFSTYFLFISYWYSYRFIRWINQQSMGTSDRMIRTGILLLALSSIGPWVLGPIIAMGLSHTTIYYLAVYLYLHLLYNGSFVFIVFGAWFRYINDHRDDVLTKHIKQFYRLTLIALIPAYSLSVLWTEPHPIWFAIALISATIQLFSLYPLWKIVRIHNPYKINERISRLLLMIGVALTSYAVKLLLQFLSALPYFASKLLVSQNTVIVGYLHLVLLGFVSCGIFSWLMRTHYLGSGYWNKLGILIFLTGIIGSESLLFGQTIINWYFLQSIPSFHLLLMAVSTIIPIGVLLMWYRSYS